MGIKKLKPSKNGWGWVFFFFLFGGSKFFWGERVLLRPVFFSSSGWGVLLLFWLLGSLSLQE